MGLPVLIISTHTLTWSVTTEADSTTQHGNFNSHAHVERDVNGVTFTKLDNGISTHTLTWSVTANSSITPQWTSISTHTLTWSVTLRRNLVNRNIFISTHTLTWSVTSIVEQGRNLWDDFNSHAHVERDIYCAVNIKRLRDFNSHAHVERDINKIVAKFGVFNFNSHAHVERDQRNLERC